MPKVLVDAVETHARLRARGRDAAGPFLIGVAAMLAGGLAASGASAQLSPGVSGSSSLTYFDNDEAMRTLRVFGICYASRHPEDSLAFMATDPASQAEADLYRRMFRRDNQNCLGENTEIAVPVALVRGAIVEGLYRNGTALPANLALSPPPPGTPIRTLSEAARCYTVGHRDQVRTLIEQTQPGSRQELAALTEMAPDFFRCIPDTARGRRFDSAQIRYRLAEALYRMPATSTASAGQE